MKFNNGFNLDQYLEKVCANAGVHPDGIMELWEKYTDKEKKNPKPVERLGGYNMLSFRNFLKIFIIQNWDPVTYLKLKKQNINEFQFINMLKNNALEPGVIPISRLVNYIHFLHKHLHYPYIMTNFNYSEKIYSSIDYFGFHPGHTFIFGEYGTGEEYLIMYLTDLMGDDYISKSLDCAGQSDETLNLLLINLLNESSLDNTPQDFETMVNTKSIIIGITNFQEASTQFQQTIFRLIDTGKYFDPYSKSELELYATVICAVRTPLRNDSNSHQLMHAKMNHSVRHVIELAPLRIVRNDIPLIIYLESSATRCDFEYDNKMAIPFILLKYWLTHEKWQRNQDQLQDEVIEYTHKFYELTKRFSIKYDKAQFNFENLSYNLLNNQSKSDSAINVIEAKKNLFFELIKIPSNAGFKDYISKSDLEPYEIVEPEELVQRPYLYYALRHFDKEKNEWDFDPETIRNFLLKMHQGGLSEPFDLFGKLRDSELNDGLKGSYVREDAREAESVKTNHDKKLPVPHEASINKISSEKEPNNIWHKDGDIWHISFDNQTEPVTHSIGMNYIGHLLVNPNKEFSLLELVELVNPEIEKTIQLECDVAIDEKTRESCEKEIKNLETKLRYAESIADESKAESLREEIADIQYNLNKSINKYSKPRKVGSDLEKIRKKIGQNIRYSYKKINKKHKSLANHLKNSIQLGKFSRYIPEEPIHWDVKF